MWRVNDTFVTISCIFFRLIELWEGMGQGPMGQICHEICNVFSFLTPVFVATVTQDFDRDDGGCVHGQLILGKRLLSHFR